jgi:endogenous inhibitor of DNA gyrase (YacG/DUF329 family)
MLAESILTTEHCPSCAHVFARYLDHMPDRKRKPTQALCPGCGKVVTIAKKIDPKGKL